MPDFYIFVSRHSESMVQALIEQIERREGIRANDDGALLPLEERWNALMREPLGAA